MNIATVKTALYVIALSSVAILLVGRAFSRQRIDLHRRALSVNALSFLLLTVSNPYIALTGLAAIGPFAARLKPHAAALAIFMLLVVPAIAMPVAIGSLPLVSLSTDLAAMLGFTLAFMLSPRGNRGIIAPLNLSGPIIVAILIVIEARGTAATNWLRVVVGDILLYIVPSILLRRTLTSRRSIDIVLLGVVLAGAAISLIAIFESYRVWPIYQIFRSQYGISMINSVKMRGGILRAAGPLMNPPQSGFLLCLCFLATLAAKDLFTSRLGYRVTVGLMSLGLFAMQSRGPWVGAIVGITIASLRRGGVRRMAVPISALALSLGSLAALNQFFPRIGSIFGLSADATGSNEYRINLISGSAKLIAANPIAGQPMADVMYKLGYLRQGEGIVDIVSGYLTIGLITGLTGLALLFVALLLQFRRSIISRTRPRFSARSSFDYLGVSVTGAVITMLFFSPIDERPMMMAIFLFLISDAITAISRFKIRTPDARSREPRAVGRWVTA